MLPLFGFSKYGYFFRMFSTALVTFVGLVVFIVFCVAKVVDIISGLASKCISHEKLPNCFQSSNNFQQVKSLGSRWTEKIGKTLCPFIFPKLFTEHRIRAQAQETSPKVYIVFLNRDLNGHCCILLVFSLLSILVLAASAFLTSIPLVTTGTQCLEVDKNGYPLLCYTKDSAYPEDCTNINHTSITLYFTKNTSDSCLQLLSYTDIRDFPENFTNSTNYTEANIAHYTCYSWTLHIFGVAFASATGVFKLAIVFTTAYVRMSEWCLIKSSRYVKWISVFGLCGCGVMCLICYGCYSLFVINSSKLTDRPLDQAFSIVVSNLLEYTYLPLWMCLGFAVITWKMEAYCKQTEYCTLFRSKQIPPPRQLPEQERQCGSLQVAVAT